MSIVWNIAPFTGYQFGLSWSNYLACMDRHATALLPMARLCHGIVQQCVVIRDYDCKVCEHKLIFSGLALLFLFYFSD